MRQKFQIGDRVRINLSHDALSQKIGTIVYGRDRWIYGVKVGGETFRIHENLLEKFEPWTIS